MTQRLTGPALVEYLRDNPTSDAMRAAADEIERLRDALEDSRRAMFAVLSQEPRMKAVAKRVLARSVENIDAALTQREP